MILNKKSIESIISYILNKGTTSSLYEKKHIFFYLRNVIRENPNLEGMIKYVGYGSHGIILEPSIKIDLYDNIELNKKFLNKNYVSKILQNNDESPGIIYNEYLIGKKLEKIDPNNNFFIYPVDIDSESKEYTNIIMKKGYSLAEYLEKLQEFDIYKIFFNLLDALQILIDNNIFNFDIKSDNILLSRVHTNKYKCVFIDFTSELVLENKEDFLQFCKNFKKYIHPYWPYEVNCILNYFYNKEHLNDLDNDPNYFSDEKQKKFEKYEKYKTVNSIYYKKYIHPQLIDDLNHNLKKFYEKIMIFEFGKMFQHLINNDFKNYDTNTYKDFKEFINYLINDDYTKRYNIKKIKEKFKFSTDDYTIFLKK